MREAAVAQQALLDQDSGLYAPAMEKQRQKAAAMGGMQ